MVKQTYSEKLKDPRWQKLRLKIMERDGFKCVLCHDEKTTLNIHHEEYKGEPWQANPEKLKTVSKHCHFVLEYAKNENFKFIGFKKMFSDTSRLDPLYLIAKTLKGIGVFFIPQDEEMHLILSLSQQDFKTIAEEFCNE